MTHACSERKLVADYMPGLHCCWCGEPLPPEDRAVPQTYGTAQEETE